MQIHRQAQAELAGCCQGEIGRPLPVDHQRRPHRRRRAVQIDDHRLGISAARAVAIEQIPGPQHLLVLGLGLIEQVPPEAAVEIPVHITPPQGKGGRVAQFPRHPEG